MTRQEKYPETLTFCYYNANPKNRITNDCIFRAISLATERSWEEIVKMYYELVIETGYDGDKAVDKLMNKLGWVKNKQPRKADNTKYTGSEFCKLLNKDMNMTGKRIVANIGGHHMVCIKESRDIHSLFKVHDIWDSTEGCIGNYWTRKE